MLLLVWIWAQLMTGPSGVAVLPQAQAAPSVVLTLRLSGDARQFRPGEIIRIELEFSSATPQRFTVDGATYDRSGHLLLDDFAIDRIDDVTDPMLDYLGSIGGALGGGIRGVGVLGEKPYTVKLELNEWFRFDTAGVYTLAVTSRRVHDESATPRAIVPVESNRVSFEILPRDPAWEASQLDAARRIVEANSPTTDTRRGCRMMRFLGTETAALEMVRRYGGDDRGCEFEYMAGLFGALDRAVVVHAMQGGLRAPDRPVTAGYLRLLAALSVYLQHPELRPTQTRQTKGRMPAAGESRRRQELIDASMTAYRDIVTAALPDKTDRARAVTLLELQASAEPRPPASTSAQGKNQLAAQFLNLPAERQAALLDHQWRTIAGPAMLPVLRRLVEAPAAASGSVFDLALRRLAQLAPNEARPLLLREIRNPRAGATLKTLASLPDAELPDLDEVLAANFEASRSEINAGLVSRYATRRIAHRILARSADDIGRLACAEQQSILAYVLRVDEAAGATLLDRARGSRATGCWQTLHEIPGLRLAPEMEARIIADLDDPDPDVVIAAMQMLGRQGSAAALEPLRAAFQRWHAAWANRAAELARSPWLHSPNARQAMVEDGFRQAIGSGRGWLMRAGDVRALQSLCVTDNCRMQTAHMIHDDDTRITLWNLNEPDESHIELAQYTFRTMAALEEKLVQYPRGTVFTLATRGNQSDELGAATARLVSFATSRGLLIRQR